MSKLIRFKDSDTARWSRVDLDNGDPIWVSIAQSGVLIKKSRLGLLGAILFRESEVISCVDIARTLSENIDNYSLPNRMSDMVLRSYTQTALDSKSATDLCSKIADARNKLRY